MTRSNRPPIRSFRLAALLLAAASLVSGLPAGAVGSRPGPASAPAGGNHLVGQTSPYLLEHLDNPVDWYPWGDEALARARHEDKPIFLSIGYSACHWCHVMARESFSDPEIARLLNRDFVAIKVDREERPDLDAIYMDAVVLMTGGGGWPMSVFLTPDLEPFHGGTYFPKDAFRDLLTGIASTWKERRQQALAVGKQVRQRLERPETAPGPSGTVPARALLETALAQWRSSYDPVHGGFGGAPKFPSPLAIQVLLRDGADRGAGLAMAKRTLEAMAGGGLYDQLGGGFHRYATDAAWRVPHFEKMLSDNALLAPVYLEAWRATGRTDFRRVAEETLAWAAREMTDARGGFCASLDADSEGEEGRFYLWTTAEVRRVLGDRDAPFAIDYYGMSERGDLPGGGNVLHVPQDPAEFARRHAMSEESVRTRVAGVRSKLLAARGARTRPRRDDKILTAWNGLMISAFARAAALTGDPRDREAATRAARFARDELIDREGRVLALYRPAGAAPLPGTLDDSAFLARGLLDLYDLTADRADLDAAARIVRDADRFLDRTAGGYFFTAQDRGDLIVRTKSFQDQALPSGNAVLLECRVRLARALGDPDLIEPARRLFAIAGPSLRGAPAGSASMILAALLLDAPPTAVAGRDRGVPVAGATSLLATPALAASPVPASRATAAGADDRLLPGVIVGRANAQKVVESAIAVPGGTVRPGQAITLSLRLTIAPGWHINSSRPTLDYLIATKLEFPDAAAARIEEIAYPEGSIVTLEFAREKLSVYQGATTLRATISPPPETPAGRHEVTARLIYQACSDKTCLAPETAEFRIPIEVAGAALSRMPSAVPGVPPAGGGPGAPPAGEGDGRPAAASGGGLGPLLGGGRGGEGIQALLDRRGFLAGLALNLTPCVYPMMPVTIGFFASQSLGSWGRRIGLPALYVLGMAVTYSILGLVAGLTGTLFGSTLQSPFITGGLVLIFIVMALSMFGLFEITMPAFLTRFSGGRQGSLGAFLMGLTMGIAAAPCIGPFIVPLLAFVGVSGKPVLGFWLFFVMAIGMGVPNLLLGAFSGALAALPRSGLWLIYAKKVMGVALLAVALYFLQPFIKDRWLGFVALGFAAIAALYLGVLDRTRVAAPWFRPAKIGIALLILAAGVWVAGPLLRARPEIDWRPYTPELLEAAKAAGRPVIIDFAAAWCLPCRELERFTFADAGVLSESQRFTLLKADLTSFESAPVRGIRSRFEVVGVPTVIFIDGRGIENKDLRVYGFEEAARFVERMRQIR